MFPSFITQRRRSSSARLQQQNEADNGHNEQDKLLGEAAIAEHIRSPQQQQQQRRMRDSNFAATLTSSSSSSSSMHRSNSLHMEMSELGGVSRSGSNGVTMVDENSLHDSAASTRDSSMMANNSNSRRTTPSSFLPQRSPSIRFASSSMSLSEDDSEDTIEHLLNASVCNHDDHDDDDDDDDDEEEVAACLLSYSFANPDTHSVTSSPSPPHVNDGVNISTKRDNKKQSTTSATATAATKDGLIQLAKSSLISEIDVAAYMAGREMTPFQERMNAITMIPNVVYCLYFLFSGAWFSSTTIGEEVAAAAMATPTAISSTTTTTYGNSFMPFVDDSGCIHSSWFPNLYALPPLPVMAAAFGIIAHAPFSFIYHWKYAHRLPPGLARTDHWSRRMDQAMIHIISLSMSYATSGQLDFFLANLFFNVDCMYRQFKKRVRPRANKIRIGISILMYTLPVLRRGDIVLFSQLWSVFAVCAWLFAKYPIGGWSHSAFHLVIALIPPLLMTAALELPASQAQLQVAGRCYYFDQRA